jgi:hypothetical protein
MERYLLFLWEATSNWKLSKKELKEFTFFTPNEAIDTTLILYLELTMVKVQCFLGLFRSNQGSKSSYNPHHTAAN